MLGGERVLIFGLGNIGYTFAEQYSELDMESTLSHFQAAVKSSFKVVGGIDSDFEKRDTFSKNTGLPSWPSIKNFDIDDNIDICVIATPKETHLSVIKETLSKLTPKLIICEKPFGGNALESKLINNLVSSKNIPILVNYNRQFSSTYLRVLNLKKFHDFKGGLFVYNGGLRQNGSHFLRLFLGLLGMPKSYNKLSREDSSESPSFELHYEFGILSFINVESGVRTAQGFIESQKYYLKISSGKDLELYLKKEISEPKFWPFELEIVVKGTFNDGFDNLYGEARKVLNGNSKYDYTQISLDIFSNSLIDEITA